MMGGQCSEAVQAYAAMMGSAMSTGQAKDSAISKLDGLKSGLPDSLVADFETISGALKGISLSDPQSMSKMDSQEVKDAGDPLQKYFESGCKGS